MDSHDGRTARTAAGFAQAWCDNMIYGRGQALQSASLFDEYVSLSYTVRDFLSDRWRQTTEKHYETNPKFVYYLSAEYMLGKQLAQNLLYTDTAEVARDAAALNGEYFAAVTSQDIEPGLGNGGLGRLAACFLDSLATLDIPSVGYGIRYQHGIFNQAIVDGKQVETPDEWLIYGFPWEFPQSDHMIEVQFGGYTQGFTDEAGHYRVRWTPGYAVRGQPYHVLVPGYKTNTVNMLRLWSARASREFDFQLFDVGDYTRAVETKTLAENITKVLYPNDNQPAGQELRLKQQYFLAACSLHDIMRRFKIRNSDWTAFPDKVAIHLNDTHPVIAIPELMRLLVDEENLDWDMAWGITQQTFAYTCHTLLPEALEKWPVHLFESLLPRHLEIIYEINRRFLEEVRARFPTDAGRVGRMSLIEEGAQKLVRMAYLAVAGSHSTNGVAELHSTLLKEGVFHDFYTMWPERFNNKTNGVTPRRFVKLANPLLSDLITSRIGDGWVRNLDELCRLEPYADDAQFRQEWRAVKQANKERLADYIQGANGITVDPSSIFDIMVKRLHEYKRQILNALHIVTLYNRVRANPQLDMLPRTFVFGAKAAPGYYLAKQVIHLLNSIAGVVNSDPAIGGRLKVAFLANFNVSLAQIIYPAADISEQISLAGMEASGTGNMKFALNGALTVGTLDGANIEIRDRVGPENFFLFGMTTPEVYALRARGYNPWQYYESNPELKLALDQIDSGYFSNGDPFVFRSIVESLKHHDRYMALADFAPYVACQEQAEQVYRDQERWTRMSILNVARCGFFSSDRTIREYCEDIWKVTPAKP